MKKEQLVCNINLQKHPRTIKKNKFSSTMAYVKQNYDLYLFLLPTLIYFIIFAYIPMYGVQIAFKDFNPVEGITGSPWVGFKHFITFFKSPYFTLVLKNTVGISIYQLLAGFPIPIIFALLLNQLNNQRYKKIVQTVTYAPYFLSTVVLVGMIMIFLNPTSGLINQLIVFFGGKPIFFMAKPEYYKTIYVLSDIWQGAGWGTIIYLAALSGISPELHEAAVVDGANKFQRVWHIDIPGILPTIVIMLILNLGNIMSVGFEKGFLMQNDLNASSSEIISTYVYKMGLVGGQFSFSAAVGLFNSVVNFVLLIIVNKIAKNLSETSLW